MDCKSISESNPKNKYFPTKGIFTNRDNDKKTLIEPPSPDRGYTLFPKLKCIKWLKELKYDDVDMIFKFIKNFPKLSNLKFDKINHGRCVYNHHNIKNKTYNSLEPIKTYCEQNNIKLEIGEIIY